MRGWRRVGEIRAIEGNTVMLALDDVVDTFPIPRGSIIGVSPLRDGPLRAGLTRFGGGSAGDIPAMCVNDHLFVATAIGEDVFRV